MPILKPLSFDEVLEKIAEVVERRIREMLARSEQPFTTFTANILRGEEGEKQEKYTP